jgi:hypothetical protein
MIEISAKMTPYSKMPGTECVVPCSDWVITAFPAMLRVAGLLEVPIGVKGPVNDFLVQMDLERDCVWISGMARDGYYRLELTAENEGLWLKVHRAPKPSLQIGDKAVLRKEKILLVSGGQVMRRVAYERVFFGSWKAQDWDLVRRRNDVREALPPLFLLGQKVPASSEKVALGKMDLFFRSAFSGILVPRLQDGLHQGIEQTEVAPENPFTLLRAGYESIRASLFEEKGQNVHILPDIQKHPVGRASLYPSFGALQLEWTQGMIRRMIVTPRANCEVTFVFPKEVASFRVGDRRITNNSLISLQANTPIFFDRFQK